MSPVSCMLLIVLLAADPTANMNVKIKAATTPEIKHADSKQRLPEFRFEPPDVLRIEVAKVVPKDLKTSPSEAQQVAGDYLVAADGTVNLGVYGTIHIADYTLSEAKEALEKHLQQYLQELQVTVDVAAYNCKVYYVILDGAGEGDRVIRLPITGGETVLDALSQVGGLTGHSVLKVWIARPILDQQNQQRLLPINWIDISQLGIQSTNYELLPGDRLYIRGHALTRETSFADTSGVILLSANAIRNLNGSFNRDLKATHIGDPSTSATSLPSTTVRGRQRFRSAGNTKRRISRHHWRSGRE